MTTNQAPTWRQRCGGRYAVAPAAVLEDRALSIGARLLFAVLCAHADNKTDTAKRSLNKLAADIGVGRRSVMRWIDELELARRIVKLHSVRKLGAYRLIRCADDRDQANCATIANKVARAQFADHGRRGSKAYTIRWPEPDKRERSSAHSAKDLPAERRSRWRPRPWSRPWD